MVKYVISVPNLGQIKTETVTYLLSMVSKYKDDITVHFRQQCPTSVNRNEMVRMFLETDAEWLLFLDDDMNPKYDLLEMTKHNEDVVSGLTLVMQNSVPYPLIMKRLIDETHVKYRMMNVEDLTKADERGLLEVGGVGGGCLLIRRGVFDKIEKPYFQFLYMPDGTLKMSEDYYFSEQCHKKGIKMYVDTTNICGHMKKVDLYDINRLIYKCSTASTTESTTTQ